MAVNLKFISHILFYCLIFNLVQIPPIVPVSVFDFKQIAHIALVSLFFNFE